MEQLQTAKANSVTTNFKNFTNVLCKDFLKNKYIYLMLAPVLIYFLIIHYLPMYGAIIAFKDFNAGKGILGSPWVGFKHFESFFTSVYFWRLIKNTLLINFYGLLFGFPFPIIFALLLNEVRVSWFKKTVQTVTYMPHFISLVIICGMIVDFCATDGLINSLLTKIGFAKVNYLAYPQYFRTIFVSSGIWMDLGWGSIIYLATIANVEQSLYEAAKIDGANRFRQIISITIPSIMPTIIILLILNVGHMMTVGWEKIILLYSPTTYETADVISSYVYRRGIVEADYSFGSAIGLFNSVINFFLIIAANTISRKFSETSIW